MPSLRMPEQDHVVDVEDQGSGARGCLGHAVLGIFEAQKLFDVAEANLQWPASGKEFQDLYRGESEIEREEAIVAAATTGIAYHHDTQELLAGTGIPQGVDGLVPELDLLSVKCGGGLDPLRLFVLRHLKRVGQAVAFLATASAFGDTSGGLIEGGLHVHAADQPGIDREMST